MAQGSLGAEEGALEEQRSRETPSPGPWWNQDQAGGSVQKHSDDPEILVDIVMGALTNQVPSSTHGILGKHAAGSSPVLANQLQYQRCEHHKFLLRL